MSNVIKYSRPLSAFSFFVKLYCKKKLKHSSKYCSKVEEASKSWLSLNKIERQEFVDQYEECLRKKRKQYAAWLQKTEPYLRKKKKGSSNNKSYESKVQEDSKIEVVSNEDLNIMDTSSLHKAESVLQDASIVQQDKSYGNELQDSKSEEIPNSDLELTDTTSLHNAEDCQQEGSMPAEVDAISDVMEQKPDSPKTALPEPMPPCVTSAKDLYYMLNKTDEFAIWKSVPDIQKRRYQRAVLILKKDYINKYKNYLESLSSSELFKHYCNKMESSDTYILFIFLLICLNFYK